MHKLTLALGLLIGLVACNSTVETRNVTALRKSSAPIYSIAQVDSTRLAGRWTQAAGIGDAGCKAGGAEISGPGMSPTFAARWCDVSGNMQLGGRFERVGPGRFQVGRTELWVIWVDTDYRTLVLGDPQGHMLLVLNRNGRLPADRFNALREVLEFNGYRVKDLRPI